MKNLRSGTDSRALASVMALMAGALMLGACRGARPASPPATPAPASGSTDPAEAFYRQALTAGGEGEEAVLERLARALRAGACPTRALTESAFGDLHTHPRFRDLIREHCHQSVTVMVLPEEPGERLFVTGILTDEHGRPLAGALVHAFQTDARGLYSSSGEAHPRLFGYARSAADGRYGFHTIRPGHYPDESEPVEQHIHFEITPDGGSALPMRLGFADDPHWVGRRVPDWAMPVEGGPGGERRCRFDLTLRAGAVRPSRAAP